ncbi:protein NipSnap homolog 2-like [Corticium candelabrum]|uniref:protein NipSnap homolog 2-like n=1 Tax=Corticium candelabrum TaxID=121492 RepID=UPI002E2635E2|nr:protein NipSnap homolog 2-like [Corticium candelabrum]
MALLCFSGTRAALRSAVVARRMLSAGRDSQEDNTFLHRLARRFERGKPPGDSHAKILASAKHIYEIQFHDVKPDCIHEYQDLTEEMFPKLHQSSSIPAQLVGSWTSILGKQDEAVHLWYYENGWSDVSDTLEQLRDNVEWRQYSDRIKSLLSSRRNQLLMEFAFWGKPVPRNSSHIYELRSYRLRPGTLIDWSREWEKGILFRQEANEAVGGFFSQIGLLYEVYHIWAYSDLSVRQEVRENAWMKPGWDDCWARTISLVQSLDTRIMLPAPYSSLQ